MKQHDVMYKTEVTTTVIQEPPVVVSQFEMEQKRITTPMSVVSEKVCLHWMPTVYWHHAGQKLQCSHYFVCLQEFLISAFEEKIIQEVELRIMRITYRELVTEDGEVMVTAAEREAVQPAFDTPVKNYRIMEGMGVTFHCKMDGKPLPKVPNSKSWLQI